MPFNLSDKDAVWALRRCGLLLYHGNHVFFYELEYAADSTFGLRVRSDEWNCDGCACGIDGASRAAGACIAFIAAV